MSGKVTVLLKSAFLVALGRHLFLAVEDVHRGGSRERISGGGGPFEKVQVVEEQ